MPVRDRAIQRLGCVCERAVSEKGHWGWTEPAAVVRADLLSVCCAVSPRLPARTCGRDRRALCDGASRWAGARERARARLHTASRACASARYVYSGVLTCMLRLL